ncbi:MAG: STAS/SEC14 domain-containing protein [Desulfobacterales bacterium]|nr:STAS/SEC14 domain-containing protein [Desulfobacterales bacterium]
MIFYDLDENAGVLTVRPEGKLETQDFLTLSEVVDPFIKERGGLNGIIIVTKKFPGWEDFNGMIEHMRFVRNHHRKIAKVAIVTDSKIADVAESLGKHFVKASIKHFSFKELESAKGWMLKAL